MGGLQSRKNERTQWMDLRVCQEEFELFKENFLQFRETAAAAAEVSARVTVVIGCTAEECDFSVPVPIGMGRTGSRCLFFLLLIKRLKLTDPATLHSPLRGKEFNFYLKKKICHTNHDRRMSFLKLDTVNYIIRNVWAS